MLPAKNDDLEYNCWTYILGDDDWINNGYKTKEEARNAAIQDARKTCVGKITVSIGYRRDYDPCKKGHAYDLIRLLQQDAITEFNGVDCGWLDNVTDRDLTDLDIAIRKILLDWFARHHDYDPVLRLGIVDVTDEESFELYCLNKGGNPID